MNRPGGENQPPAGRRGPPPPHRPSRSQEEALRARRQRPNGDGPSSPPQRTGAPRPRRNSDSSLAERSLTDDEKKERERRRRDREDRKGLERRATKSKPRIHRDMDLIDKLDATSIYGTGSKFSFRSDLSGPILIKDSPSSLPPCWPLRCCYPISQDSRQASLPNGGVRQGLCQHVDGRLWPTQLPS